MLSGMVVTKAEFANWHIDLSHTGFPRHRATARAIRNLLQHEVFSEKRIIFSMASSENAYFERTCRNLLDFALRSWPQGTSFTLCRKAKTV
jgi:hypothetical protein